MLNRINQILIMRNVCAISGRLYKEFVRKLMPIIYRSCLEKKSIEDGYFVYVRIRLISFEKSWRKDEENDELRKLQSSFLRESLLYHNTIK